MSKRILTIAIVAAVSLPLGSCQTSDGGVSKQQIGTVLGTVAGGLIGSQFGKGTGQIVAVIAGSAIGGLVGSYVGEQLDAQDRKELEARSATALASVPDGQSVAWASNRTDARAQIVPSNTRTETRNMTFVRSAKIESPVSMRPLGKPYQANSASNVRSGPSTQNPIVDGLQASETFTAMGSVGGDQWIVVGKNGVAVGYVAASLVSPASQTTAPATLAKPVNLDDIQLQEGYVAEEMVAQTECRTLDYNVQSSKGSGSESFEACRKPDGSWEIG